MSQAIHRILFNYPQFYFLLVMAKITVALWGRATGKTTGLVSTFIYNNASKMPRSLGAWVVPTYAKVLTQMIPNFVKGMENIGLVQGQHYVIGKFFDERYNVTKPYTCPQKPTYFVHFANGSGFVFISLDRASTMGNGLDLDWIVIDEAKMCPYDKVKEVLLAVRGNMVHFGHLSCHHSTLIASDKPTSSKGQWLYDYHKKVDKQLLELIVESSIYLEKLKTQYDNSQSLANQRNLSSQIKKWEKNLNELRKQAVFVTEASTFENIAVLGIEVIRNFYKTLTETDFLISVWNKTLYGSKNDFYPLLDDEKHGYHAINYTYVDKLEIGRDHKRDCRWDADLKPKPLEVGFDHNNAINWVTISQPGTAALLRSMYVMKPKFIDDLVDEICAYYEHHKVKVVHYYYNHTSKPVNASGDKAFYERVSDRFKHNKWQVIHKYYGKEPGHFTKYNFFGQLYGNKDSKIPEFKYNIDNNEDWFIASKSAQSRQGKTGFEKDKSSERDANCPPQHATHATEASDCLYIGKYRSKIKKSSGEFTDYSLMTAQGSTASA
jgi:hypothetical protein